MLRTFRKSPGFTAVAVLTLALGIGANSAIFSVVETVLLSPLAYNDPDRIVSLGARFADTGRLAPRLAGGDLVDVRKETRSFAALSSFSGGEIGVQLREKAEFTGVFFVNPEFFRVIGAEPRHGRLFTNGDEPSAVVSTAFAAKHLGGAENALGQKFSVEHKIYEVVGVIPAELRFPRTAEIWLPSPLQPRNLNRTAYNYPAVARLKAGVSLDAAQAELTSLSEQLANAFPDSNRGKTIAITPLKESLVGPMRRMLYFLLGAVSLVLLIACANVANLLLARGASRGREFAVRVALGAGRGRILRQLAIENLALGLAGGALGLLLAWFCLDALTSLAPQLPRLADVRLNAAVLAFTMAVSVLASLVFGLMPAMEASRVDLSDALKQGGMRGLVGARSQRLRQVLVAVEIALSVTLAVGAALLLRSFLNLHSVELGYRPEGILVMYAHAPAKDLPGHIAATRHYENVFTELGRIPRIESVAAVMGLPTGRYGSFGMYAVEGIHKFAPGEKLPSAGFRLTSPGYFHTIGIRLERGRDFTARDQYDAPFVAIVSQSLVKQVFGNEDPIGRRLQCGLDSPNWMTIVGVVSDVRQSSPADTPEPQLYMPFQQHPFLANELQVVLRAGGDPRAMIPAVQTKMRELSPSFAIKFTTLETMVHDSVATPRFRTFLLGLFAFLAIALAMAGVYGIMNYMVSQRTSEFGLRMALGASPGQLLRSSLGQAAVLAAIGLAAGAALSFALHKVVDTMLFGITGADWITYASVAALVLASSLLAAFLPSLRASRVDPMIALREE
ncbi:MAG: ABC transporter permease [Bryobacterales bacterium]|nr:ABC transporter permease [Bryobacterales bacterium]